MGFNTAACLAYRFRVVLHPDVYMVNMLLQANAAANISTRELD